MPVTPAWPSTRHASVRPATSSGVMAEAATVVSVVSSSPAAPSSSPPAQAVAASAVATHTATAVAFPGQCVSLSPIAP